MLRSEMVNFFLCMHCFAATGQPPKLPFLPLFSMPRMIQRCLFINAMTLLRLMERGYYRIIGRLSVDIIKSRSYKLTALEIEDVLLMHPQITECVGRRR